MTPVTPNRQEPPPGNVSQVVEHLFRHESAKMVAILTRIFGIEHLPLADQADDLAAHQPATASRKSSAREGSTRA